MTTLTIPARVSTALPGFGTPRRTKRRAAHVNERAFPIAKAVALDRGAWLRIKNGRGTRIRVAGGVLWVTEENSPEDHVLHPGDAIDLARPGTALALAHRSARVVIEVPAGVKPPRSVELVLAHGDPGRHIRLGAPGRSTLAAAVAKTFARTFETVRAMPPALRPDEDAAQATSTEAAAPMMYSDGYPPRHLRVRAMRDAHLVERAVVDERMMWRM